MNMKTLTTKLRTEERIPPAPPAVDFWQEFGFHARNMKQGTVSPVRVGWPLPVWRLAWGGLASALMALALWWGASVMRPVQMSAIQSLNVVAAHRSLFIMNDTDRRGVIVWVDGLQTKSKKGS